ncbi:MAG: type IV pilus twitching motility protein PilT [Candidatus Komeilibacteria bacterium]
MNKLFNAAIDAQASDLHLIAGSQPFIRIDGVLQPLPNSSPLAAAKLKEMVFALLTVEQKKRLEEEKDLDFSHETSNGDRLRINVHWEKGNIGLVARVIPGDVPTMEELAMPAKLYEVVREQQGLILLTGPTGSGKTTSMAAMIDLINHERASHIITLEDPIEYIHEPDKSIIIQRELGEDMLSFQAGLKHALRQDPNVIMVGEMRDLDTIAATLTLAETGHLVMATLHTHDAAQTVDRIVDVFPPHQQNQIRLQLSFTLKAVLSQHLLPAKEGGRIAARELMISTPAIANIIRENKIAQLKNAIQTSSDYGMFTVEQDVKRLIEDGKLDESIADNYLAALPDTD